MKIGLGLYRQMLNDTHYKFAQQLGVSHIVAHLVIVFPPIPKSLAKPHQTGVKSR